MDMNKENILFIKAITPIHNGSGGGLGMVDRPIIRERITSYPFLQASTLKGGFRDVLSNYGYLNPKEVDIIFGNSDETGSKNAGFLNISDGSLLCFPIRSLKGGFVWAISPLILHRFYQTVREIKPDFFNADQKEGEVNNPIKELFAEINLLDRGKVIVTDQVGDGIKVSNKVFLEEFASSPFPDGGSKNLSRIAQSIANLLFDENEEPWLRENFAQKLIVLPEDEFSYFINHATEIQANIRIGDKGVTEDGSLRYTEYLPAETILYSLLVGVRPFNDNGSGLSTGTDIEKRFREKVKEHLKIHQIGGDETTGKGMVALVFLGK